MPKQTDVATQRVAGREFAVPDRYDLVRSLRPLTLGLTDRSLRCTGTEAWWATRTPDGPASLHLRLVRPPAPPGSTESGVSAETPENTGSPRHGPGRVLRADGYGPGAAWVVERADAVAGLRDDLTGFDALAAEHPLVRRLAREQSGVRMPRSGRIFQHVVPAVLGQKVTRIEADRGYRAMCRHFGEPAPGPAGALGVLLPPDPAAVAGTPYWVFHPWGVEQRRADTIRRAAERAAALERAGDPADATRRLTSLPGIGPWTAAEVVRVAFGDPDTVTVGDYHLPNQVAYALAGEARGDDARMLELLAPFAGHRGRVCQLLVYAGVQAPKFGPRMPVRSFARF